VTTTPNDPDDRDDIEREQEREIATERGVIAARVVEARAALYDIERRAVRLGDGRGNLYDVEFVESDAARLLPAAITQGYIALAAIETAMSRGQR
jgi:hypothetical protein